MPSPKNAPARSIADLVGVVGSGLCALHCMIVPTSLVVGPLAPLRFLEDGTFHHNLLWLVAPAAVLAVSIGCLQHRDRLVLWMGTIGLSTLIAAFTILHDSSGENGERLLTMASAGILVAAHVRNFRLCRSIACSHAAWTPTPS
ncbi:MAG: MerC domain-containing protein [bacterium]